LQAETEYLEGRSPQETPGCLKKETRFEENKLLSVNVEKCAKNCNKEYLKIKNNKINNVFKSSN
jgi:hypothetical protein